MIGDKHAIKIIFVQNAHQFNHVNIAIVNKHLIVIGHIAFDIAKMHIADAACAADRKKRALFRSYATQPLASLDHMGNNDAELAIATG